MYLRAEALRMTSAARSSLKWEFASGRRQRVGERIIVDAAARVLRRRQFSTSPPFFTTTNMSSQSVTNPEFKIVSLFDVQGWVAVVTGGGTGIGLMCALALANNGAKVYIVGRRQEVLENTVRVHGTSLSHPTGRLIPIAADVTSKEALTTLAQTIAHQETHLDLLVNNAGISIGKSAGDKGEESANSLATELWSESVDDWVQVYKTNVISYFFTTVALLPLLAASTSHREGHSSSVINISSMSGITNVTQNHISYNVSKAATNQLNQMLAQELSRPGVKVRVNAIAPGVFPSEMTTGGSDETNKSHRSAEGFREEKNIPAGRPGRDQDMAQAVLHLAVNQYANGQVFTLDGGFLLKNP